MTGDKSRNRIAEDLLGYMSEFGLDSDSEEKLLKDAVIRVLEGATVEGMSQVRKPACSVSSEERDEATTEAAALGAHFGFLRGVEMTRLCGQLGRNVEGNGGVWIDPRLSGFGEQVACRAVN